MYCAQERLSATTKCILGRSCSGTSARTPVLGRLYLGAGVSVSNDFNHGTNHQSIDGVLQEMQRPPLEFIVDPEYSYTCNIDYKTRTLDQQ